jgi:predicted nucleotidyltransferase
MFIEILERLATALERAAIPYMVIGGQAVLVYGEPRLTRDIDVTLGIDVDRLQEVRTLAAAIGWQLLVDEQFTRQTMVLPCMAADTGIRVDFIFSFTPYEHQAIARAKTVKVGSTDVRFAAVEDLVVHKVLAGRPRDLEDVKTVLLKQPGADCGYIRKWLTQFAAALDQPLVERFESVLKDLS